MNSLNEVKGKIPDLEILAKQVVDGFIIGMHKSPFHGFSVEFAEHRLYNPGDNLRHVDWKVYGRSDKMFSKKYEEETNLRCCIAIDTSPSMVFESEDHTSKLAASAQAAACIIELLKRQMDASAIAFFDEQLHLLTKSGTSSSHKNNLFSQLEQVIKEPASEGKQTNVTQAMHELAERLHKRSLVVIFSDMLDGAEDIDAFVGGLQHLKHNKHEVILFMVGDKRKEWDFELNNRPLELRDMETNEVIKIQPDAVIGSYRDAVARYIQTLIEQCARIHIDFHLFDIQDPPEEMLRIYLMKRMKMM